MVVPKTPLTDADIVDLGIEAGHRVNAMPEYPTQENIDEVVFELKLSAIQRAEQQRTMPEGTVD